ncbi:HYR domain-containing protein [Pseudochryseolinea flava]|nr:HYR domain-containing protein [Pseudochryseolinea flava]
MKGNAANQVLGAELQFVGDINNDGLEDLAFSDELEEVGGLALGGRAYIVFGSSTPFPKEFDPKTLNGSNGFMVDPTTADERRGQSIAGPGDINGDGIDDIIVSATSGELTMVIYGRSGAFPAVMKVGDINGTNGFVIQIDGTTQVDALGDMNGDGINDFAISNPHWSERAWVIFGRSGNFPASINNTWLDGVKGFMTNPFPGSRPAYRVGAAGDINNDGYDDLLVGNWASASAEAFSFLLFGRASFTSQVELTTLNGTDGFRIENAGNNFITCVGRVGDINGDGMDDCFSENNLIFGSTSPFPSTLSMSSLNGNNGALLDGYVHHACSAGDLSGDGIDDLLVVGQTGNYVVFGTASGFPALVDPEDIDGTNGFTIPTSNTNIGRPIDGGKDFNGDGFSDFAYDNISGDGTVAVVFGGDHIALPLNNNPSIIQLRSDGFRIRFNAKETGIIRYAVYPSSTPLMNNLDVIDNGTGAIVSGSFPIGSSNVDIIHLLDGLAPDTEYDVYVHFLDDAGNKDINYHHWDNVKTLPLGDITPPSITCPGNQTVVCTATTIPDYTALVTATDNTDPTPTVTQSPVSGSTFVNGMTITMTATDDAGNTQTCTFTVTKTVDAQKPTITCPTDRTLSLNATIPDYRSLATVTDNCDASPTVTQSPVAGTIFTGPLTVTLTATDASSNVQTCSFFVGKAPDTAPPTITCSGNQSLSCASTTIPSYVSLATVSDNEDATPTVTQSPAAGSPFVDGMTVTLTAIDDEGNVASCNFIVAKTTDTQKPIINCPGDQVLTPGFVLPNYVPTATTSDNCDMAPVVTQSPASGTMFITSQVVTLTVTDASGNSESCSFNVTPAPDVEDPTISCPGNQSVSCTAITLPSYISLATVSDNQDATPTVTQSPAAGSPVVTGMTVTLTATDDAGNTATCSFVVSKTVDAQKPTITCPGNKVLTIGETLPDYRSLATAVDNCDLAPVITQSPASGGVFMAATVVTLTVTDASGNSETCSFTVTPAPDTEAPAISCAGNQSVTCMTTSLPNYISLATVSDNQDATPTITQSPATGTPITNGMTVTLTATDDAGNSSTCSFMVAKPADTQKPIITCPANTTLNMGDAIADYTSQAIVADNCDATPTVTQSPIAGTSFTGALTVTLTAKDASGNTEVCSFSIAEAPDSQSPTLTCPGDQLVDCDVTTVADYTSQVVASDNKDASPTVTQSPAPGTTLTNGMTITLTAADIAGNETTCSFTINVKSNVRVNAGRDVIMTVGGNVQLSAVASIDNGTFLWTPGESLDRDDIPNPVATPLATTTYKVLFTTPNGCTATDEVKVEVKDLHIPEGFSPDGDGLNENWILTGIEKYKTNEVNIFNRWGNCVYSVKGYNNQTLVFNGNANRLSALGADNLPDGTYFYSITLNDSSTPIKGFIVLKR